MATPDLRINPNITPEYLSMLDFISRFNEQKGPAKSARFAVRIFPRQGVNAKLPINDLMYMCDAAQLPGRGFNVTEARYYGPSLSLPNNSQYETANFSFICRQGSRERFFFDEWMEFINPTTNFNFEFAENYWSDIKIYQFAEYSSKDQTNTSAGPNTSRSQYTRLPPLTMTEEMSLRTRDINSGPLPQTATAPDIIYGWNLRKAWPILVMPQQVTWQDQDILRLQVTFTYRYWDREGFVLREAPMSS